jgi:RimJ/RimL family protein N-acetyltransferase
MNARVNEFGQPIGPAVIGWSSRPPPPRTPMAGRYVGVMPIDVPRHTPELFRAYMRSPEARDWTYLFVERPESEEAFRDYLIACAASDDPLHQVIVDAITGKALGTAAYHRIDAAHGVIEVGSITFSPLLKGARGGTEAMYLMMRRAFDELGYRRYEWKCDSLNAPSRAAALRYGFTFEGIFRKAVVYKSRSRDTAWYAITEDDWPRVRHAFETWLDPDNFDSQGRQRQRLADLRRDQPTPR